MDRLTQDALNNIIIDHRKYVKGMKGGVRAVVKFKDLSGLSMRGHDMSHADFSGSCLDNVDLSGGYFRGASFFCCDLQGANMAGADFTSCDFRGACIINSDLSGSDLSNTDLRQGVLMSYAESNVIDSWGKDGKTRLQGSVVRNTNLSGVRAVGTNFKDSNLHGARMHEADLQGSNFEGANLSNADMMGCNLVRANMTDVVIDNINLVGVDGNIHYAGMLTAISDRRLKEDIKKLEHPLDDVMKLSGYTYHMKDDSGSDNGNKTVSYGLIAQEVEQVYPSLVVTRPDGMKSLNYIGLIAPLLEAVKTQNEHIVRQQQEINALRARLDKLDSLPKADQ